MSFWMLQIRRLTRVFSDFETAIYAAAATTFKAEHLMSYTRTAIAETITSFQDSDWEYITVSEEHNLLKKIHDIL